VGKQRQTSSEMSDANSSITPSVTPSDGPVYRNVATGVLTRNLAQWLEIDEALHASYAARPDVEDFSGAAGRDHQSASASSDFVDVFLYGADSGAGRAAAGRILQGRTLAAGAEARAALAAAIGERDAALAEVRRLEASLAHTEAMLSREQDKSSDLAHQLYYGGGPRTTEASAAVAAVLYGERMRMSTRGTSSGTAAASAREESLLRTVDELRVHNQQLQDALAEATRSLRDRAGILEGSRLGPAGPEQRIARHNFSGATDDTPMSFVQFDHSAPRVPTLSELIRRMGPH
jgi:hypothetical protein